MMKFISLILSLIIVMFLMQSQLFNTHSTSESGQVHSPLSQGELEQLGQDIDQLMLDTTSQQKQQIDDALNQ